MIDTPMAIKPMNEIIGPTTMRRVLKMSGLKPLASLVPGPNINRKPMTITTIDPTIINMLSRESGNDDSLACSVPSLPLTFNFVDFILQLCEVS